MHRNRRTKILATLGPATNNKAAIRSLFEAGADLFRINMSHFSHDDLNELVSVIREVEDDIGRPIGILADLQGPKLRLGEFSADSIEVKAGDRITFDSDKKPGDQTRIYLPHPEILSALNAGDRVLVDDGKVTLKAIKCAADKAELEVVTGTTLSSRKGVSLPDTELGVGSLTPKDYKDLDAVLVSDVDWVAI